MWLILFLQVLCSFDLLRLCHGLGTSSSIGGLDAKGKADRFTGVFEVLSLSMCGKMSSAVLVGKASLLLMACLWNRPCVLIVKVIPKHSQALRLHKCFPVCKGSWETLTKQACKLRVEG